MEKCYSSQLADRYVSTPNEVVKLHEHVMVRVTDVDLKRKIEASFCNRKLASILYFSKLYLFLGIVYSLFSS